MSALSPASAAGGVRGCGGCCRGPRAVDTANHPGHPWPEQAGADVLRRSKIRNETAGKFWSATKTHLSVDQVGEVAAETVEPSRRRARRRTRHGGRLGLELEAGLVTNRTR